MRGRYHIARRLRTPRKPAPAAGTGAILQKSGGCLMCLVLVLRHVAECSDMNVAPLIRSATEAPSLRTFLAELSEEEVLRISEPMELDFLPTALVLELEKQRRTPVVMIEHPVGFDMPVVANLFASRDRI